MQKIENQKPIKKHPNAPENIKPHPINVKFDDSLPRHWFGGNAFMTHILNTWTVIFPDAERYFVRWSRKALQYENLDPKIRKDIQGFIGQETRHASEHEKLWELLQKQGYDIQPVLDFIHKVGFDLIENNFPDTWNLAAVAGFEHFTAMFAEIYFESPELMNTMHPEMKRLFEWHAAEEVEHKAVAFDQLQAVNDSYLLRISVMNLAVILLYGISVANTLYFMLQDRSIFNIKEWAGIWNLFFGEYQLAPRSISKFIEYYRPDFHPWEIQNYADAVRVFDKFDNNYSIALSVNTCSNGL
ncbi:MAG: metal-dependent hydrolase [Leptospiraceae bacterium]|nr:metal-dependent hydrolase [Leptospiraceae bacterium]